MKTTFSKLALIALVLLGGQLKAQTTLDHYIAQGLTDNIVLKQRNIALEKAMVSLQIANSYFAPTVGLQGNYTSGLGGRSINIPVGDLLNPVYKTLNQLTNGESFPQIANVKQNFFPYNFYDAKVHTTVPIFNSDLYYNRKIAQRQVVLQDFEVEIYKRELVKNIKVAYYNHLSALEAVKIYTSALSRAEEGKRVNESLLSNGKGLSAYVLRSQSEIETTNAQKAEADRQIENTQLYFNFLLNRNIHETIEVSPESLDEFLIAEGLESDTTLIQNREELKLIRESIALNSTFVSMNKLFWLPKLNGFVDLGSQAQNWTVNQQSRYYLTGLQIDIPVFAGWRNKNKTKTAMMDVQSAQLGYNANQQQLDMSARISRNNLYTASQNFQSARKQQEAAQSYQKLIERGYKEGVNTFIETVDARNQLTQAQLQVTLTRYRTLSAAAQFERETASYQFPSTDKK